MNGVFAPEWRFSSRAIRRHIANTNDHRKKKTTTEVSHYFRAAKHKNMSIDINIPILPLSNVLTGKWSERSMSHQIEQNRYSCTFSSTRNNEASWKEKKNSNFCGSQVWNIQSRRRTMAEPQSNDVFFFNVFNRSLIIFSFFCMIPIFFSHFLMSGPVIFSPFFLLLTTIQTYAY